MRPQDLTRKILELEANHGFVLPKGLLCTLVHNSADSGKARAETTKAYKGIEYWWFMTELDADGRTTPLPHRFAERICAWELLKCIQPRRPELRTTHDGDWMMEIASSVPSPAIHWDRAPADMVIDAIHAYCVKTNTQLRGYNTPVI